MTESEHRDGVKRIQEHIARGDIYQANLTQAFDLVCHESAWDIYQQFSTANPAPFAAFLRFPPGHITRDGTPSAYPGIEVISCSPERFWRKRGRRVETRPIKGTIARGEDNTSDRAQLRRLLRSEKDRAELLMITDLERNDLGRIAEVGTVRVPALRRPRAYASVWHLESTITATLAPETSWQEVMRAVFPGGSITGAPKRRAVEILGQIERVPRGVYCGAIGWVDAAGDADFSIAIRTAVKIGSSLRVHSGGGIVSDSDPAAEYQESLVKIAPMLALGMLGEAERDKLDLEHESSTLQAG